MAVSETSNLIIFYYMEKEKGSLILIEKTRLKLKLSRTGRGEGGVTFHTTFI